MVKSVEYSSTDEEDVEWRKSSSLAMRFITNVVD